MAWADPGCHYGPVSSRRPSAAAGGLPRTTTAGYQRGDGPANSRESVSSRHSLRGRGRVGDAGAKHSLITISSLHRQFQLRQARNHWQTHDYRAPMRDSIGPGGEQVKRAKLHAAAVRCSGWFGVAGAFARGAGWSVRRGQHGHSRQNPLLQVFIVHVLGQRVKAVRVFDRVAADDLPEGAVRLRGPVLTAKWSRLPR